MIAMTGMMVTFLMRAGTIPTLQGKVQAHTDRSDEELSSRLRKSWARNSQRPIGFGFSTRRIYVPGLATRKDLPIGKPEITYMLAYKRMDSSGVAKSSESCTEWHARQLGAVGILQRHVPLSANV